MLDKKRLSQPPQQPLPSGGRTVLEEVEVSPLDAISDHVGPDPLQARDVTSADHPLSLSQSSQWNTYFQAGWGRDWVRGLN
jgi:hypothetical protein